MLFAHLSSSKFYKEGQQTTFGRCVCFAFDGFSFMYIPAPELDIFTDSVQYVLSSGQCVDFYLPHSPSCLPALQS